MKLPNQWRLERFDELANVQEGQVSPKTPPYNLLPHVGADNIVSGGGLLSNLKTCEELGLISGKYPFKSGAVVYSKIRPNLNKVCRVHFDGVCSADAYPIYPKASKIDPDFLVWGMRGFLFVRQAVATSMRTGMPKINRDDLGNIELLVPPIAEQKAIATILGAWAHGLEAFDALIAAKERRRTALMQQLLTGTQRLFPFRKVGWKRIRMSDVLSRVFRPIEWSPETPLALVSIRRRCGGLFRRPDIQASEYRTQDLHEVRRGDFLISKRQVVHGAWAMVTSEFSGCQVSKEYAIMVNAAPEILHMPFFGWLAQVPRMIRLARVASTGVHIEKLIFDPDVFLRERIRIPSSLAEQQAIATILDSCDEELRVLRAQRAAIDQQKRGLMQRLLTGRLRVRV